MTGSRWPLRRRAAPAAAIAVAATALALAWLVAGGGPGVSLLAGPFPRSVEVAAAGCWALSLARRGRRWWRVTLPALTGVAVLVVAATAATLRWTGTVNDHYPPSFALWFGAVVLAVLVCTVRLRERRNGARRRIGTAAAVLAVPLSAATAVTAAGDLHPFMVRSDDQFPAAPGRRLRTGHLVMNRPVVGIGALSTDFGEWLVGADGGVFSYGAARFYGSAATTPQPSPVVAIAPLLEE